MAFFNCKSVFTDNWNVEVDEFEYEFDHYSKMCFPCFGMEENTNVTNAQEKLLLWHWKLGISKHWIHELI